MKKILALLLLVCILCGCTPNAETKPQTQSTPTTQPTQSATQPTTQPDPDAYVEEPVELVAVSKHTFYQTKITPNVAVLDGRAVAFVTREYRDKAMNEPITCIRLLDPHNGNVRKEAQLDGHYTVSTLARMGGRMVLMGYDSDQILVLDKQLHQVLSFEAPVKTGILSADLTNYYYLWGSRLRCLNVATGEDRIHEAGGELLLDAIWGYDPQENVLMVSAFADSYTTKLCMAAMDLDDGSFKLLYRDVATGDLSGSGVCLVRSQELDESPDVYFGNWTDENLRILPGFMINDPDFSTWHIGGSDYILQLDYDKQRAGIEDIRLYDLCGALMVSSLQPYLKGAKINYSYALPDGNLLLMAMGGRGYQTYLVCPEKLEFTDAQLETTRGAALMDATILENYEKEPVFDLPENLSELRETADRLEATYGVTVLISSECGPAASGCSWPIRTTDQAGLDNEEAYIREALELLEEALQRYPSNFFRQFKNEAGEKGLLVLLVEDIGAENIEAIGVSYTMGQWYPVAIDITSGEVANTICHEIWHATENRINDLDSGALDLEAWQKLNPVGFHYGGVTADYYKSIAYTFYDQEATVDDIYFIDPYAKTKGEEDRARLMEYIMSTEVEASIIMQVPVLRAKLKLMSQAIRDVFDTEGWEDVYWERFF